MSINVAEFKANCLKLIYEVAAMRELLVITKRGKPVARLMPIEDETPRAYSGICRGRRNSGDIIDVPHEPRLPNRGGN